MKELFAKQLSRDEDLAQEAPCRADKKFVSQRFTEHEDAQLVEWDSNNRRPVVEAVFERVQSITSNEAVQLPDGMEEGDVSEQASAWDEEADDARICSLLAAEAAAEWRREVDDFDELVRLHAPYLQRFAARLSGNRTVAEDLVQDTFTRALSRLGTFERETHIQAFLVTIMTRLFYDQRKHEKVVRAAEPQLATLACADDNAVIPSFSDASLRAAVDKLDVELRTVVECCYLKGMRYREAARELGLSVGTVSTRLRRARLRLKGLLIGQQL